MKLTPFEGLCVRQLHSCDGLFTFTDEDSDSDPDSKHIPVLRSLDRNRNLTSCSVKSSAHYNVASVFTPNRNLAT